MRNTLLCQGLLCFAIAAATPWLSGTAEAVTRGSVPHAEFLKRIDGVPAKHFSQLELDKLAAEDTLNDALSGLPRRFAVTRHVDISPANAGEWTELNNGDWLWQLRIRAEDAAHLNFGFSRFALPPGAALHIVSTDGKSKIGPFTDADMLPHGQLWTPVVLGEESLLHLRVPKAGLVDVVLQLDAVNQGYRGFGSKSKACKSGACNTDVACLSEGDPWNQPRRSVGAWTRNGTATCTGSLVNNTANDRRMLFATATHCGVADDAAAATVLVYWNYESPTCRVPSDSGSSPVLPRPATTSPGVRFIAQTANPFSGGGAAGERSDFTLLELATPPQDNDFNLFWAGWDRRPPSDTEMLCSAPADETSTMGLCASIHHPSVDEKRITFVETDLTRDDIANAADVHWLANWDPTPPRLPNISPMPESLPPSVTEPGSSGSPLYNAEQRLVGVLSGGASFCGASPAQLNDQYGGLFHAWEGLGTPSTRMRDHLDPLGDNPEFINGIGSCDITAPATTNATATGPNQITVSWSAVPGVTEYRILRGTGTCPNSLGTALADVDGGATSYVDNSVSGGTSYVYRVVSIDPTTACLSDPGPCAGATATGTCALPPTFNGLASATSAGAEACGIELEWSLALGNCGDDSELRYNVYRSSNAEFTPGPGSLLESCLTETALADMDLSPGEALFYAVRAEDLAGAPPAGQCGGVEDTNMIIRSAAAFGPDVVSFSDDVESGDANWAATGSGAGADFTIVTTASSSPPSSWFVPDPSGISDRFLTLAAPLGLSADSEATLEFAHRYQTETGFDGSVLEYSLDGGTTWTDILAAQGPVPDNADRFIANGYVSEISGAFSSPLAERMAWSGNVEEFVVTQVELADFAGQDLLLRFRFASDTSVSDVGWWIDDIRVFEKTACEATNVPADATQVILRRTDTFKWHMYLMDGFTKLANGNRPFSPNPDWTMRAIEDFDGDGVRDLLIRNSSNGNWFLYYLDGATGQPEFSRGIGVSKNREDVFQAAGDLNGDGFGDVLTRNATGWTAWYLTPSGDIAFSQALAIATDGTLETQGVGDLDGNGTDELLLRDSSSNRWTAVSFATDTGEVTGSEEIAMTPNALWQFQGLGDFDGNGADEVLLRRTDDNRWLTYTFDENGNVSSPGRVRLTPQAVWTLQGLDDFDGDGATDAILRRSDNGRWILYRLDGRTILESGRIPLTPTLEWQAQ